MITMMGHTQSSTRLPPARISPARVSSVRGSPARVSPARTGMSPSRMEGWPDELPSVVLERRAELDLAELSRDLRSSEQRSRRRRSLTVAVRLGIAVCAGIAVTLAAQPYGNVAREVMALLGPASPAPQVPAVTGRPSSPAGSLEADLDAVRESMDRITQGEEQLTRAIDQLTLAQALIAKEIATFKERYLVYKNAYEQADAAARAAASAAPLAGARHGGPPRPPDGR